MQYIQSEHSFLATVEKIKEVKPKETQKRKGGKADAPATKKAKEDAPTKPAENRGRRKLLLLGVLPHQEDHRQQSQFE